MTNEKLDALKLKLKDINDKCLYESDCLNDLETERRKIKSEDEFCDDENYYYEDYHVIMKRINEQEDKIYKLRNEYINVLVKIAKTELCSVTNDDLKTAWLAT